MSIFLNLCPHPLPHSPPLPSTPFPNWWPSCRPNHRLFWWSDQRVCDPESISYPATSSLKATRYSLCGTQIDQSIIIWRNQILYLLLCAHRTTFLVWGTIIAFGPLPASLIPQMFPSVRIRTIDYSPQCFLLRKLFSAVMQLALLLVDRHAEWDWPKSIQLAACQTIYPGSEDVAILTKISHPLILLLSYLCTIFFCSVASTTLAGDSRCPLWYLPSHSFWCDSGLRSQQRLRSLYCNKKQT